ncbi:MAG: ABC transporter substrate-binding protein [Synergistaceae bacterium]|jgi:peptide/nickel transport system substrate-binding protein|nr:ABC transporter substrate-binding protein [Synergistaceae bacterium]
MKKFLALFFTLSMLMAVFCGYAGSAEAAENADKVLTVRTSSSMQSTDWAQTTHLADAQILWQNVFEGLYGMNEARGGYYHSLAKDVKISEDQLTYTITLVDATFQNGEPLKASDVVFTYKRALDIPRLKYLTSMLDTVSALDDKTVVFKLKYPYSAIEHTFFSIMIYSEKEVKAIGDSFGTKPHKAGTGAYYIDEYDPASSVKLKAHEGYWRGAPNIKNIDVLLITENSAAVIAYENGEIGYMHDAPTSEWEELVRASDGRNKMIKGNNVRTFYINYESKSNNAILANPLVRKAIFYAIDKETINKISTGGYGSVADEYMPSEYVKTSPPASAGGFEVYKYNPEKAKSLLKEAGFTDEQLKAGVPVGTILTYGATTGEKAKCAQVIQSDLSKIGLKSEVQVGDINMTSPMFHSYEYDLGIYGDSGNFDFNNIRQMVHSESKGMDLVRYKTDDSPFDWRRIEELLDLGVSTSDVEKRVVYYTELWKIVMDTATILPLINMPIGVVWGADVDPGAINPSYYQFFEFSWK